MRDATSAVSVGLIQRFASSLSTRMSIACICGSSAAPKREVRSIRAYFPLSALTQVSRHGVAEARITCASVMDARSTAMSRAL